MKHKMPLVKNVMTAFPYFIEAGAPIAKAREMMYEHKIRHLPVMDKHELVGILSERDVDIAFSLSEHILDSKGVTVETICRREVFSVDIHAELDKVALSMADRHIGSAVVLKEGRLAGIFTSTDACRFLGQYLQDRFGGGDDEPMLA
ncbi:MAG: CBS domain-containing protein [Bdellovibrionota bacterium]